MARLPYLDADDLAEQDREIVARGMNLHRLLAHSPEAARRFSGVARYLRFDSPLDPRLREMAILQVCYLARSPYAYSHHVRLGRAVGVSEADIRAIETESAGADSGLPDFDRTVLRAAREMTARPSLTDATFEALRAELSETQIVDLVVAIALYNGAVRLLGALEVDVEPDLQPELDAHPLPKE